MGLFKEFISEFKVYEAMKNSEKVEKIGGILGTLNKAGEVLLLPEMYASKELIEAINRLKIRAKEPMKVAITGQFSSGKSTFLNALLAKNILPTGITPVTSKVNYIRYGDEFRIKVRYKDGGEAFYGIENISAFTDQRNAAQDIDFLTLYAPLELLKDIIFVDTPGLNSQSFADTATTEAVLKEVDGIIWLSLIDNAGKMSEAEVLEQYLSSYQNKSLCVLNQKDKFTPEQVKTTAEYVQNSFAKYFSQVIPISAKQALESRSHDRKAVLEAEFESTLKALKAQAAEADFDLQKIAFQEAFSKFAAQSARGKNVQKNEKLLRESNIEAVLEFIFHEIQPLSISAKEFAITKDVKLLVSEMIGQEERIIHIYDELSNILDKFQEAAKKSYEGLKSRFTKALGESFLRIEEIIDKIASEILSQKTSSVRTRYVKESKLFREGFKERAYEAPKINADEVYKKLFFDDDLVGKMFKKYLKALEAIQDEVNYENAAVFKGLETQVLEWQKPYELIRKEKGEQSDIQFANIRKFASKAYENILKPYEEQTRASFAKISSEFKYVSSAVKFNYQNAAEVVVAFLERKIENSIKLYEENPTLFSVYEPKLDEIKERLKTAFHMYELENMMNSKKSIVTQNYDTLEAEFARIKKERLAFLEESKKEYVKLQDRLKSLSQEI